MYRMRKIKLKNGVNFFLHGHATMNIYAMLCLALFASGCASLPEVMGGEKKKSHIVMIQKNRISPNKITVSRGSVVVWINGTSGTFINVYFTAGKQVEDICSNPTRFFLNDDGEFNSGMIPPGSVASICFLRPGTYNYLVGGFNRFEYGSVYVVE